jgi:hypothetical protein
VMTYTPPATPAIALAARPSSSVESLPSSPATNSDEQPNSRFGDRLKRIVPILK